VIVPLTNGGETLIDDSDASAVLAFKWMAVRDARTGRQYVHRTTDPQDRLHRFILGPPEGVDVDHKNGDGLDNRRSNIRIATRSQNNQNWAKLRGAGEFKGVTWDKQHKRYRVQIQKDGKHYFLGLFTSPVFAAMAYDETATEKFGEFCCVNFPVDSQSGVGGAS